MNTESRTIFIGDVHGCYDELKLLIKKLSITENDRIFLTGDLINRGPKSYKVLKFLHKNKHQYKAVVGNNEINFLRYIEGKYNKSNNIFKKLKKKISKKENIQILSYLKTLPKYIEEDNFILIHGGLNPDKTLKEQDIDEITRIRLFNGKPWYNYYKGDKKIIYGHWAEEGIHIRKNTIGIDSGCTYGSFLTAYTLETGEIIQQSALKTYENIHINNILEKIINIFK